MKKILLFILACTIIVPAIHAQNLVLNPGFETQGSGGSTDAANWTEQDGNVARSNTAYAGIWGMNIYTEYGSGTKSANQTVAVTPGKPYRFSLWLRSTGYAHSNENICGGSVDALNSDTGWVQQSCDFSTTSSSVDIVLESRAGWDWGPAISNGYFDDINLSVMLGVDFVDPTPADSAGFNDINSTYINVSVANTSAIDTALINWNGTNIIIDSPSLVGWWNFNNNTNDSSRYANHGTQRNGVNCSSSVEGKYNSSCKFDGINDVINTSATGSLDITGRITVEAWIKINKYVDFGRIVSKEITSTNAAFFMLLRNDNLGVGFIVNRTDIAGQASCFGSSVNVNDGNWHYVVGIHNDTVVATFVDGSVVCSSSYTGNIRSLPNEEIDFGILSETTGGPFNGSIDEVRIWNRSLTAAEKSAIYKMERGKYYLNITNQNEGAYTYYALANTSSGQASTENRTIYFDRTTPQISFVDPTPANNSNVNLNSTYINASTSDANPMSVFIDFNKSLVGYWNFDNHLFDNSTYGNNGTPTFNNNPAFGPNLVLNPGFEDGSGTDAYNWTEASGATRDSSYPLSGSWSMHLYSYCTLFCEPPTISANQTVSGLIIGRTYNLSAWGNGAGSGTISLVTNPNVCTLYFSATWTQKSCVFVATGTTLDIKPAAVASGPNIAFEAYFDDIILSDTTPFVPGKYGKALKFDGIDDYVNVSDSSSLKGMSSLTVEAWIYYSTAPSGSNYYDILQKENTYNFRLGSSNLTGWVNNGSWAEVAWTGIVNVPANKWHHVAYTWTSGSAGRMY